MGERRRTHIHRRKQELIARDARYDGAVCGFEVYVFHEEAVPFGGCGTEDSFAILCQHVTLLHMRVSGIR
jgi:hypothetical protein